MLLVLSLQYDNKESTAPLALVIKFLLSLGRFCPKKVSSVLPKDIRKDYPSQRARGEHGSSDPIKVAREKGAQME